MNEQALIFQNLLNGVPVKQVCLAFNKTETEVLQTFSYVLLKVKSYVFLRQTRVGYPTIIASTIEEAKKYRLTCLSVLPKLNLSRPADFKDIQNEIVTPDNVLSVTRNLNT